MLSDRELVSIIKAHRAASIGRDESDVSNDRTEALDRYHGRPYGDEVEGRSQVLSRDLMDTVEWMMPYLMRTFTASDDLLRFDPVGPEDEELAEQETLYTNHVLMKQNDGWLVLHDWFKDALLLKTGYVKHYWDESEDVSHEDYEGLSGEELALLMAALEASGDAIEVVGHDEAEGVHSLRVRRTRKVGREVVEAVPPEEVRVSERATGSIKDAPFVEHRTRKTRSELIEMGMPRDFVDDLPAFTEDEDSEENARDTVLDTYESHSTAGDRSMDEVEYCEAYLKVDYDEDGVAELRKVITTGGRIPPVDWANEEISQIPLASLSPYRVPHRHIGLGLNDIIGDLARIKTVLFRQALDNVYLSNNARTAVDVDRVNLDDLLTTRPGGVVRVTGDPASAMVPIPVNSQSANILPVMEYVDSVKEFRVGVGDNTIGLNPDVLQDSTKGAYMESMRSANAKLEMVARMFAETGVKELVLGVHQDLLQHSDQERVVSLRGSYMPVNPSMWRERTDMTVTVGLGTGTDEEQVRKLMMMADLQERGAQAGIVGPQNAYRLAERIADRLGFKERGVYFTDPESPEGQQLAAMRSQPQPNPLAEAEQIKGQVRIQEIQAKGQMELMKERQKASIEQAKLALQAAKQGDERALKIAELELEALVEGLNYDIGQPGVGAEV